MLTSNGKCWVKSGSNMECSRGLLVSTVLCSCTDPSHYVVDISHAPNHIQSCESRYVHCAPVNSNINFFSPW